MNRYEKVDAAIEEAFGDGVGGVVGNMQILQNMVHTLLDAQRKETVAKAIKILDNWKIDTSKGANIANAIIYGHESEVEAHNAALEKGMNELALIINGTE